MTTVPPFSLERPRYDQSQFLERARHFFELTNPRTLLTTDAELKSAKGLLQQFRDGTLPPGTACGLTEQLFKKEDDLELVHGAEPRRVVKS